MDHAYLVRIYNRDYNEQLYRQKGEDCDRNGSIWIRNGYLYPLPFISSFLSFFLLKQEIRVCNKK